MFWYYHLYKYVSFDNGRCDRNMTVCKKQYMTDLSHITGQDFLGDDFQHTKAPFCGMDEKA